MAKAAETKRAKVSLAIAPENALPSTFVVFRDKIETSMAKSADLGYDGVELALLHRQQIDVRAISRTAARLGLQIPMVSTGQVFAAGGVWLTSDDETVRATAMVHFIGLMEVAAELGADINIGRLRGMVAEKQPFERAEANFLGCMDPLAERAAELGVRILIEPVNRYETNYINSCESACELLAKLGRPNVLLMPDVFHMNIEDRDIAGELDKHFGKIGYIHFADSNRLYPGNAHTDFPSIVCVVKKHRYEGFIGVEILPSPDPDTAAARAIEYLLPLLA